MTKLQAMKSVLSIDKIQTGGLDINADNYTLKS